jgi:hypothetical protein
MSFPTSPTDGQVYTTAYGSRYRYYLTDDKWIKDGFTLAGVTGARGATGVAGTQGATGVVSEPEPDVGLTGVINVVIDGGGSAITSGVKADIQLPFGIALNNWSCVAKETGSIYIDLWRTSYNNFPPTVSNTMHAGQTGPRLLNKIKDTGNTSAWAGDTGAAGEYIRVNVNSATTVTLVTMSLNYAKI